MPNALSLAGYSPHQRRNAFRFIHFLNHQLRVWRAKAFDVRWSSNSMILGVIDDGLRQGERDDLFLLHLEGHGNGFGWEFNEGIVLEYAQVIDPILQSGRKALIINSSCYGGTMIPALQQAGAEPDRVGLIAAAEENTEAYGDDLVSALEKDWGEGRVFHPKTMRVEQGIEIRSARWGAVLETLLWER